MNSVYYYPASLHAKLAETLTSPVTVVEAPAGYGKTTAMKRILSTVDRTRVFWFTAVHETAMVGYNRLCDTIGYFDPQCGTALKEIGFPNRSNTEKIVSHLRSMQADEEAWFVIDNMQFLQYYLPSAIIKAFTEHRNEHLHVVLITQFLGDLRRVFRDHFYLNGIYAKDLTLRQNDIMDLFAKSGLPLSKDEAKAIYRQTEGWAVAVSLSLQAALDSVIWKPESDIEALLHRLFWEKLRPEEQRCLLPLALFDSLNSVQLRDLFSDDLFVLNHIEDLLQRTPLVQYDDTNDLYFAHAILSQFLMKKLEDQPYVIRQEIYPRSGRLFLSMGRLTHAIECFYAVKNYEEILKTDLLLLEFSSIAGNPFVDVAQDILENCPREIKIKYPLSLLRLAYYVFNATEKQLYDRAMKEAREIIWSGYGAQLKGEWYMMSAFYAFPDLDKMGQAYEFAAQYMDMPSLIFTSEMPYMFGNPSMWYFFYTTPGKGDDIGDTFTRVLESYMRLTNNHGAGADVLYRGELASLRCDFSEALQCAYEAMHLAELHQNVTVAYGVALLIGRVAIISSDMSRLKEAIDYLETKASAHPFMQGKETNKVMLKIVRGMLHSMLDGTTDTAQITTLQPFRHPAFALATMQLDYVTCAEYMMSGEFEKAISLMKNIERQGPVFFNTATQYYVYLGMSLCYMALTQPKLAQEAVLKAIGIAEADSMIAVYLQFRKHLTPLLMHSDVRSPHRDFVQRILDQKVTFAQGDSDILPHINTESLPNTLTKREEEVALLAAKGLRNKETAEQLHISQWTVKNHLQTIYTKLDIDRRSQLSDLLS